MRKTIANVALSVALCLGLPVMAGGDDETMRSAAWVKSQAAGCAWNDAYQCVSSAEDDLLSPAADAAMIPGIWMQAWQSTLVDFMANDELTRDQKDLQHYKFAFTQNDAQYIVLYRALLLPQIKDDKMVGILRTSIGQTTKYWVDRKTLQVVRRAYLR